MKNLILIAAPGAGKGTLAKDLKEKYGYTHISTGDLLREAAAKGDELGNKIHETLTKGEFVSDDIVLAALKNRLMNDDCENGYILDGYPRTVKQAEMYDDIVKEINKDLGMVIVLDIDKELLIERITGRRLCRGCDAIYNIYNPELSPKDEHTCDKCGGELYQRSDDNLESLETRYNTYIEKTQPLIDYYNNKNCLYRVSSNEGSKVTLKRVIELLETQGDSVDKN
ncbi:MAG: adenylate kinase [Bacilli bacterium]|nr:adenylate kinase [Bacilli bacterium]